MVYLKRHLTNYPNANPDANQQKYMSTTPKGSPLLLALITQVSTRFNATMYKMFDLEHPLDLPIDAVTWLTAVRGEMEGLTNLESMDDPEVQTIKERTAKLNNMQLNPDQKFKMFMSDEYFNLGEKDK